MSGPAGGGRRVVVTGAAGSIGRAITPVLAGRWDLRPTDVPGGDPDALDVTDGEACRAAFAGADAVVHLAAVPDPEAGWEQLLPANVVGGYQVAQAAADCGVRRLVLASSLQAVSAYPEGRQVRTTDPPRPANLYGATKAWAEALGAWVASTSSTSVVALRIGYFAQQPPGGPGATARDVAAWLSPRDCAELVRTAVEADVRGFIVANGTSANRYRFADLAETTATLGYRPADDAWSGR
ncbi:MAG TPA: NAD(P)-dependent oxidoreductase [Actinomycetales bacterium]|nr:NAD(P)-dependent oxidoreductase [Actinomycetales bacterium]